MTFAAGTGCATSMSERNFLKLLRERFVRLQDECTQCICAIDCALAAKKAGTPRCRIRRGQSSGLRALPRLHD